MFEYDPQPSAAHVVRSETLTGLATRAQLSVTGTIGPRALHHLVMLPHLSFSIRVRQVDAHYQTSYCLGGARTRCQTDLAPLSMRGPADTKKWGRGSRDNLRGRGRWRGAGGAILDKQFDTSPTYSGQVICGAASVPVGCAGSWARQWNVPPIMTFSATGEKRFCAAATGGLRRNARFISRYGPGYPRGFPLPCDAG